MRDEHPDRRRVEEEVKHRRPPRREERRAERRRVAALVDELTEFILEADEDLAVLAVARAAGAVGRGGAADGRRRRSVQRRFPHGVGAAGAVGGGLEATEEGEERRFPRVELE